MNISEKEKCTNCGSKNTHWLGVITKRKPNDPPLSIPQKNQWRCNDCGHTFLVEIFNSL